MRMIKDEAGERENCGIRRSYWGVMRTICRSYEMLDSVQVHINVKSVIIKSLSFK